MLLSQPPVELTVGFAWNKKMRLGQFERLEALIRVVKWLKPVMVRRWIDVEVAGHVGEELEVTGHGSVSPGRIDEDSAVNDLPLSAR